MTVLCEKQDGDGAERVIERAKEVCMVANSLGRGVAVSIEYAAA